MRRPRKIAIKLVLFVLLGAIINVAVAWGISLRTHWGHIGGDQLDRMAALTILRQQFGDGVVGLDAEVNALQVKLFGCTKTTAGTLPQADEYAEVYEFGIPMLSLSGALRGSYARTVERSILVLREAQTGRNATSSWFIPPKRVPLRPIWPGFAINTIFYAGVLWLLFAAPGMVRRMRRRMKGRCIHCGYDLRGQPPDSAKCPECGRRFDRPEPLRSCGVLK